MTIYNVHIYREMRLRFDGIEAESPDQAAEKARDLHFDDADDWSDCEGESLAALIDVAGDEEYSQSITIDFEVPQQLKAASKLLAALEFLQATLKLRHLDEASDDEVEEALDIGDAVVAIAKAAGVLASPAGIDSKEEEV